MIASGATRPVDERLDELCAERLVDFARRVLEDRIGARHQDPPRWSEPPEFQCHCEIIQRLSGWYRSWPELAHLLRLLAVRHAYLYGRPAVNEGDFKVLRCVAGDTVPVWIVCAIEQLRATSDEQGTNHWILVRAMKIDGNKSDLVAKRDASAGAGWADSFHWNSHKMTWKLATEYADGIARVIAGRAFEARPQTAQASSPGPQVSTVPTPLPLARVTPVSNPLLRVPVSRE